MAPRGRGGQTDDLVPSGNVAGAPASDGVDEVGTMFRMMGFMGDEVEVAVEAAQSDSSVHAG